MYIVLFTRQGRKYIPRLIFGKKRSVGRTFLPDTAEIAVQIQRGLPHFQYTAGDVGAVSGGSFQIRQDICQYEPCRDGAQALLQPLYVADPYLFLHLNDHMSEGLHTGSGFGAACCESLFCLTADIPYGVANGK